MIELREQLALAEAEARESARISHGDFAKGLRVGLALALKFLEQPECFPINRVFGENFWPEVRREALEFEAQAQKLRTGHKG